MRISLAVDPGNRHTGIACAWTNAPTPGIKDIHLAAMEGIVMFAGDVERSVRERVIPALLDAAGAIPESPARTQDGVSLSYEEKRTLLRNAGTPLWLEEPPDFSRSDVNHGSEARIGYAEGWLSGLVAGQMGLPTRRVTVSEWRATMLIACGAYGTWVVAPSRRRAPTPLAVAAQRSDVTSCPDGGFRRTFRECGHTQIFASFSDLKKHATGSCSVCALPRPKELDPAEWVRDEWKRIACAGIKRAWPERYAPLVAEARGRRRVKPGDTAPPENADHHVVGVPDACEAAWIAVHALTALT